MNPIHAPTMSSPNRRPDEDRSFLSWTERAARYHRAEPPPHAPHARSGASPQAPRPSA